MLHLPDAWVWDFWVADDGARFHIFYLKASVALIDPERRHRRATIGHAVSNDLISWTEVADALVAADPPAFDDQATWTGSIVRDDSGNWRLYYTGISRAENGLRQRIGMATSPDLMIWTRDPAEIVLKSDPRWYEQLNEGTSNDEAWRDPWVFRDPNGDGWHMLITARANTGVPDTRGVVGHARSSDGVHWDVQPPLSKPGFGFSQLEVTQVSVVEGQPVLIFCCGQPELSNAFRARGEKTGIWAVNIPGLTGPFDISQAYRLTGEELYAGRLIQDRAGDWNLMAFRNLDSEGRFVGQICDPMRIALNPDGKIMIASQT